MYRLLRAIGMGVGTLLVIFTWGIVIKFAMEVVDDLLDHGIRKCEVHRFRMAKYYRSLATRETTDFSLANDQAMANRLRKAFERATEQQGEK
jgi:hypothetical protein